jgi:hypothetical protein
MNKLLHQQLDELLTNSPAISSDLECESALRVGAATLCHAAPNQITATTVVCNLKDADFGRFESLVQDVADDYGLEASIQWHAGAYSVRFTPHRLAPIVEAEGKVSTMLDLVFVLITIAFFAVALAYAAACDRGIGAS